MGERLVARLTAPGPKRILALDGGGARGLLSLGILQKLEECLAARCPDEPSKNDFRLAHYFDLIGGTSTGAIIATTLALGWKVRDIRNLYFELLPAIFDKPQVPSMLRIFAPGYKNKALTKSLHDQLGDRQLNSDDLLTGLAIHAKRIDTGSAWILTNNPNWCFFNSPADARGHVANAEFYLRDLVQASAAAPTYFSDVRIGLARKPNGKFADYGFFFDGGVSPNNNPAQQLFLTVTEPAFGFNWATGEDNLLIWSIGTGYVRKQFRKRKRGVRTSAKNIGDFHNMMYSSKVQAALEGYNHDICQQQITLMQGLSRPRFPWYVNSEVKMQLRTPVIGGTPMFTYQRYDARIEIADDLRPEHIEKLLNAEMSAKEVEPLREMDIKDRALLDVLYRTGEALGSAQLIHRDSDDHENASKLKYGPAFSDDWPPPQFNLPGWAAPARA